MSKEAEANLQGCNWHTFEDDGDSPAAKRDAVTYRRLAKLAKEQPDLCEKIPFFDLWSKRVPKETKWSEKLVGGVSLGSPAPYARHVG